MLEKLYFKQDVWSISINRYQEGEVFDQQKMQPTIVASDVKDIKAIFVADPFLIKHDNTWYVFYEILPECNRKGVIGYSYSKDGVNWTYGQVVLKTDYHLSYPYIFKANDRIYMIPEGGAGKKILLYEAESFPNKWRKVKEIKSGAYFDSSVFFYDNKWWLITMGVKPDPNSLHIYYSDDLKSEWKPHKLNPIITNNSLISRSGGRIYQEDERLIRFAQDCNENYGKKLRAIQITKLTSEEYEEVELGVVTSNSGEKGTWNKDGMHHIDIQKDDGDYLVAVDGYYYKKINKMVNRIYRILKRYPS